LRGLCRYFALLPALVAGTALWGQDLKQFEKKVTEFTLANGLHFIVVERHEAPVVSFRTWVDAGAVDDPAGATGLAHMFERLALKGTTTIGTTDWAAEKKALDAVEEVHDRLEAERNKGPRADEARLDVLELQLSTAVSRAAAFVQPGRFSTILEAYGAMGLDAASSYDHTEFQCNLPSNRLELWFLMESQRFLSPVFREFYKERDRALEEQRARVESNPRGALLQELLAAAFEAHPYHRPEIGWPSDIANLRPADARAFFEKYYTPGNMVAAIVGDVNPDEARRLAERYFGPMPARPAPPLPHTVELAQRGARRVQVESAAQPLLVWGYKRPGQRDPDDLVFRVLGLILSGGRTGVLYQELVQGQRIAVEAQALSAYPNGRYPSLFTFVLAPAREHTVEEVEKALDALLARFQAQKVDDEALSRARNSARAAMISQLDSNRGLASLLPAYYAAFGDWRELFASIAGLDKVTAGDVQRVARKYLVPSQRTVAFATQPAPQPTQPAPRPAQPAQPAPPVAQPAGGRR
jgi:predicted Zn-dependent peptidase